MLILESFTQKGMKYLFEGFGFKRESIEKGNAHPKVRGKVVSSLTVATNSEDYINSLEFKKILEDCVPPEIITCQGVRAAMNYLQAFKIYNSNNKLYVHTIQG